ATIHDPLSTADGLLFRQRQPDPERRPFAFLRIESDLALHGLDALAHDGETQAHAARLRGEVGLEDLLPDVLRDAGAVVSDGGPRPTRARVALVDARSDDDDALAALRH